MKTKFSETFDLNYFTISDYINKIIIINGFVNFIDIYIESNICKIIYEA